MSKAGSKTGKNQNPSCLVGLIREAKVWEHTLNALLSLNRKSIPGKRVHQQKKDHDQRIDQRRPVTIYRLITRGTVEEKIVQMHRRKRNLADSLLTGSDLSGKMSAKELLALIQV